MDFFKRKSLFVVAAAAMFAVSMMFVGCTKPDDDGTVSILLDDFKEKVVDEEGTKDWTNQNSIANKKDNGDGVWYAYGSADGGTATAKADVIVYAYDEGGAQVRINTGPSSGGPAYPARSTDEESMLKVLGTGKMVLAIDANDAATAGGGDYYGAVATSFLGENTELDFSKLQSIKIKGKIKGYLQIRLESKAVTNSANWGWATIGAEYPEGDTWTDLDVELNADDMARPSWASSGASKEDAMKRVVALALELDTEEGTRVDMELESIHLIFATQDDVPAEIK